MELYDGIIGRTRELLSGRPCRRWDYNAAEAWEDSGRNELVLGRDSAYELGGSGAFGVHYTCVSGNGALADRDEILLYGPDLGEIRKAYGEGRDPHYARISFLHIADPGEDDEAAYRAIRDIEFVKYHVFPRGFMLRISSGESREQVRLSRKAVEEGISFKTVGFDFIKKYRENPLVKHISMLFITDAEVDFKALEKNAKAVADITGTLTHIMEGIALDCSACSLKPVCDEVEGMRELHKRRN